MKKKIKRIISDGIVLLSAKAAQQGCDSVSCWAMHQEKEPDNLSQKLKMMNKRNKPF